METVAESRERDMRMNHRKHDSQLIGRSIFSEIRDLLPSDVEGEVYKRLLETLYLNGVMLVRDDERAKLGLEPRDEKGWTPSERVKYEQDRVAAMYQVSSLAVRFSEPN